MSQQSGRRAEALEAYRNALAVWRNMADANRAVTGYQVNLVYALNNIGVSLHRSGNPLDALESLPDRSTIVPRRGRMTWSILTNQSGSRG